ncbi:MAG: S1 RNA-binding domain-containing protein [Patescibacteria group bacterium]|nr:S1 RNA-binding domain-containing protein [Patescibacteria group bacterium]
MANKKQNTEEKKEQQQEVEKKADQKSKKKDNKKTEKKTSKKTSKKTKKTPSKKSEKTSQKSKKQDKPPQTMEELLIMTDYNPVIPQEGKKIEGTIILITDKMIKIDLGAKTEGVVADREYSFASDYIDELKEGEKIKATVRKIDNNRGHILLSLRGAASDAKWEYFVEALDNEATLKAKGIEANKGGLIVSINGVRGFVPSSQFGRCYLGQIGLLKGKEFEVKAIEVDRERNRLIFSERNVSEAKQIAQKAKALEVVEEGGVYEGVISGVKSFGLFMTVEITLGDEEEKADDEEKKDKKLPAKNIGYVEGLIHISEISWEKVDHPRNYHQVGDRVKVKVMGVDEDSRKLNLSIKRLTQDPWQKVAEDYPVGTTFTGKISRTEPFGAFVNVMPGVDGLIHVSKLDPKAKLTKGDEATVNVDSIEPEKRRMSLSMVLTEVPMGYK